MIIMNGSKIIRLSINPTLVKTKEAGESITDFMTLEFDLENPNIDHGMPAWLVED